MEVPQTRFGVGAWLAARGILADLLRVADTDGVGDEALAEGLLQVLRDRRDGGRLVGHGGTWSVHGEFEVPGDALQFRHFSEDGAALDLVDGCAVEDSPAFPSGVEAGEVSDAGVAGLVRAGAL